MAINKEYNDIQLDVKFTQASTRANLVSEENISVSFGKISKYFADLHSQAFTGYSHPTHTEYSSGLYKITVDGLGHVSGTAAVTASDLPAHTHSDYVLKTGDTMSGNLTFAVADGSDTPGIVFKRGNFTDTPLDWKIYNSSGALMMDRTVAGDTETWQNKFKVDGSGIWYGETQVSLVGHTHSQYLPKTTYEWNKEISFGNSGYLKIGSFPMYDTNITIDINATTSKTYHGTVVIATQNVSTTSMGSQHIIHVYDDPTGNIAASLRIVWTSGSRNYDIYFIPQSWSKNFIHIRALGNYMDGATDICVSQTGTAPATTSGLEPVNILSVTSTGNGNAVTKVEIDSVGNLAVTKGSTFLTKHPTITKSADTTSTASPAHGGTFTVVDSVTREANGHVTKINTKTVTLPADSNTDTKVTQTNTTTSADYRVLLSGNANDTTETTTSCKSTNLKFNPSSGGLYSFGFLWTDITGLTLDINTLTLSNGTLHSRRFIEKTDSGAENITNIPVTGKPFLLEVDLIRWASTTDYITRQRFTNAANGTYSYVRYCTSGTWGSWTTRKYTDTDTKVTSSANHYTPATASGQDKTASASGATAAWSIDVVKGVTLNTDGKGHVTGISVTSGKIPGNPNTDRYVNTASFADDSTNTAASPVKMTLTRAGSDTATVTANIPKVSSSSAGVAPKGAAVSSQSQSTKFLREDGSWAAPSYTSIPSNNVTGSGTSGYLTKWNGTNTITNGPKLGSSTTTYLNNAGNWATPPDTKNTAGSTDTSSKIFLIGATSQAANPQTYSDNEVYTTSGVLTTKKVQVGGGSCTMEYNSTTQSLDFIFT